MQRMIIALMTVQLTAQVASAATYSLTPDPSNPYQSQMNATVDQQMNGGSRQVTLTLTVPNSPQPPVSNNYQYFDVYWRDPDPTNAGPSNTVSIEHRQINWAPGQTVTVILSIPEKYYHDGSAVYMCFGNPSGCIVSPNLIGNAPGPS
jgi:hypothetical protein